MTSLVRMPGLEPLLRLARDSGVGFFCAVVVAVVAATVLLLLG